MNERPRVISNEGVMKIITPSKTRRSFLLAGASAVLLAAITSAETAAAPLFKPKDPTPLPPDISDLFSFLGDIQINHQFDTNTGNLTWDIDQDRLNTAYSNLAAIAQKRPVAIGVLPYLDQSESMHIIFGIAVLPDGMTSLHFPIHTPDFKLKGNTKLMTPTETATLKRIEASWNQGLPDRANAYDNNSNPLLFIQNFQPY